ncbi:MAG TPA: LysR substrate-binding domain-containing protein [Solirubrobacteraceae bacterium]|nr:LysR substrate-binding domain-containing protein [Solirubrobacteraceae bacterium]
MLDLGRVRVFHEVAARRSFSRAADALNFAQPSVSHHVGVLEAELGQTLINRAARPITLTEAGTILDAAADTALAELGRAERELRSLAEGSSGRIALGSVVSGLRGVVPAAVAEFRRRFPGVDLALEELQPPEIFARLRSGELDVGIVVTPHDGAPPQASTFESRLLAEQPVMLALSSRHRLARQKHVRIASLADESWLLPAPERFPEFRAEIERLLRAADAAPARTLEFSDDIAGSRLVAAGLGIALVPDLGTRAMSGVMLLPVRPAVIRRQFAVMLPGRQSAARIGLLDALVRSGQALTSSMTR